MATGVEKSHPPGHRKSSLSGGRFLKNRGFRPFEPPSPQLAHELRLSVQLPVPHVSNFSPTTSTGL
jgi:hypothetical protein